MNRRELFAALSSAVAGATVEAIEGPAPILLVLTMPEDYDVDLPSVEEFRASHNLPPILVVPFGFKLEAVRPPSATE
jgi:hypothetical protein